jgi:hypothetical protein
LFDELRRRGCHDFIALPKVRGHMVQGAVGMFNPSAHDGMPFGHHGMEKSDRDLARKRSASVREQAVGHRAIQQGADDPAMERIGVSLIEPLALELRLHGSIRKHGEVEVQPREIVGSTHNAMRMRTLPRPTQLFARTLWSLGRLSGVCHAFSLVAASYADRRLASATR